MSAQTWLRNSRGEWYVVGQGVLVAAVALAPLLDGDGPSRVGVAVLGSAICAVGLWFVALGSIGLGRNLSPLPKPKDDAELVTGGIFSLVRHPIYSGFVVLAFGWSLVWWSVLSAVAAVALLIFFDAKARREERWLAEKFGDYPAYRRRVKKLIPFVY